MRRDGGQSGVELAVILPLPLVLALGIVEFGLMLRNRVAVGNAAPDGAVVGAGAGLTAEQAAADAVAEARAASTSRINRTAETPTATYLSGSPGPIRVTASCQYPTGTDPGRPRRLGAQQLAGPLADRPLGDRAAGSFGGRRLRADLMAAATCRATAGGRVRPNPCASGALARATS
jgi:hypothetical protein